MVINNVNIEFDTELNVGDIVKYRRPYSDHSNLAIIIDLKCNVTAGQTIRCNELENISYSVIYIKDDGSLERKDNISDSNLTFVGKMKDMDLLKHNFELFNKLKNNKGENKNDSK